MRNKDKKIGQFMVAVGAIIELKGTDKILINRRANHEVHVGEWEIMYGRIDQFEDLSDALKREIFEETGIADVRIKKMMRVWHIFRGKKSEQTEVYGFTFICETNQKNVMISEEHSEYKWATVDEALSLIKVPGIRRDVEIYKEKRKEIGPMIVTNIEGEDMEY